MTIPVMLLVGLVMERGLIRHFYKRTLRTDSDLWLALVVMQIVNRFGANLIPITPSVWRHGRS